MLEAGLFSRTFELRLYQVCVKAFWLCGGQADRAVSWSNNSDGEDEPDSWAFIKPT